VCFILLSPFSCRFSASDAVLLPQRQDEFIHLVRDLLHLGLVVVGVHVQAHLAYGVAVVATEAGRCVDRIGDGVVQVG